MSKRVNNTRSKKPVKKGVVPGTCRSKVDHRPSHHERVRMSYYATFKSFLEIVDKLSRCRTTKDWDRLEPQLVDAGMTYRGKPNGA